MSELAEAQEADLQDSVDIEAQPTPGTAPESQAQDTKTHEGFVPQEKVNDLVGRQRIAAREAKERAEAAERRAQEIESRLAKYETNDVQDVPPLPDQYDDDFEAKVQARELIIRRNAEITAKQQFADQTREQELQQQAAAQRAELASKHDQFVNRANKAGISETDRLITEQVLVSSGMSQDLQVFILDDDEGPQMAEVLRADPVALDELVHMSPVQQASYMERHVRPKAAALKPKTTEAPDPAETLGGRGAPDNERGPKGAKFE
jgi:hypothetical protein